MDTPGLRQPPKKKRDPEKNKQNQKLYWQRQYAALNGIEDVKAVHRRRYHERMARMRANGAVSYTHLTLPTKRIV